MVKTQRKLSRQKINPKRQSQKFKKYQEISLNTGEAALRKHLRDHDQKAALSSEIRKSSISLELAKTRLRVGFEYVPYYNQKILSLTHYLLIHASLTTDKQLVTNKAITYAKKLPMQFSKMDTKYKYTQFCK